MALTFSDVAANSNPEPTHEERLAAARRYAGWHIGSQSWADHIIDAYLNPKKAHSALDRDGVPQRTGLYQ